MDGPYARDRLAVWTYVQHGEEIPCGDPSVTDAERCLAARTKVPAHAQTFHPLVHLWVTSAAVPR